MKATNELAIIFDMDGLMVDSEPIWRKVLIECFGEEGIFLSEADCIKTMGFRLNQVIDYWFSIYKKPETAKAKLEEKIIEHMRLAILHDAEPMSGLMQALELAQSVTQNLAIASSSPYVLIHAFVERNNLHHFFKLIYSAQDEQYGKPHPAVFLSAANKLGILPQNCIVLEDSLNGMIAARAATMKCIGIPAQNDNGKPEFAIAHILLKSLNELTQEHLTV